MSLFKIYLWNVILSPLLWLMNFQVISLFTTTLSPSYLIHFIHSFGFIILTNCVKFMFLYIRHLFLCRSCRIQRHDSYTICKNNKLLEDLFVYGKGLFCWKNIEMGITFSTLLNLMCHSYEKKYEFWSIKMRTFLILEDLCDPIESDFEDEEIKKINLKRFERRM